mmetsp:Transcript_30662/g.51907  ORF Transcript_30662/g.51907 Transcript_30662/m.51907 type:complete len:106 (-) Transcript_30662:1920-2237(-)
MDGKDQKPAAPEEAANPQPGGSVKKEAVTQASTVNPPAPGAKAGPAAPAVTKVEQPNVPSKESKAAAPNSTPVAAAAAAAARWGYLDNCTEQSKQWWRRRDCRGT